MIIKNKTLSYQTKDSYALEDITDAVHEFVASTKVKAGFINIQTMHTTTAIIVNENEPLLHEDMKRSFREMADPDRDYGHNNFEIRTVNMCGLEECKNGHSHCLAAYLPAAVTLNIIDGKLAFGQWQRIFLVELDHSRKRNVSLQVLGE
jgi:secondary thiamine-phosphate synthase enzyme